MICALVYRWQKLVILVFIGVMLQSVSVLADEFSPALLEITEREGGWADVTWKVPLRGNRALALKPVIPDFFEALGAGSERRTPGAWMTFNSYNTGGHALTGAVLTIEGLASVPTDVLVRVELRDGTEHSAILRGSDNSYTIPEQLTRTELAVSYWKLGTVHILEGFDHLLFLLTLLLIVTGLWPLLKTITAFTLAHSLTLALSTLGMVNIPPAPTEAVISLSIMLLAVEVVRKSAGEMTLAERYPWLIAFTFGLVHGLGFAGALSQIGVPQNEVPLALLMFNVGVETGQVMFVLVVSLILVGLHKAHNMTALTMTRAAPYVIGSLAAFWTIQRLVISFSA
jgi:hypothetical protein